MPASLLRRHRASVLGHMMQGQWGYCDVRHLVQDLKQEMWISRDAIVNYDWRPDCCHILLRPDGVEVKVPDDFDPKDCKTIREPSPDKYIPVMEIF